MTSRSRFTARGVLAAGLLIGLGVVAQQHSGAAWSSEAGFELAQQLPPAPTPYNLPPAPRMIGEPAPVPDGNGQPAAAPGAPAPRAAPEATAPEPTAAAEGGEGASPSPGRQAGEETRLSEQVATPAVTSQRRSTYDTLRPFLPAPGAFAPLPGTKLARVLVKPGDFDFCDAIECASSGSALRAWNSLVREDDKLYLIAGGGHADYGGNETYVFDFASLTWQRVTDPQPLTGPLMTDRDGDGVNDSCPAPAAGIPAMHHYDGVERIDGTATFFVSGNVPYCANAMVNSGRAFVYDAESGAFTPLPHLDGLGGGATAYDKTTSTLLVFRRNQLHVIDPNTWQIVRQSPLYGNWGDGTSGAFDPVSRNFYISVWPRLVSIHVPETGAIGQIIILDESGWGTGLAVSGGRLVAWGGTEAVRVYDIASGTVQDYTGIGPVVPSIDSAGWGIWGRWGYIAELDVFWGVSDYDECVWLYRLPDSKGSAGNLADTATCDARKVVAEMLPSPAAPTASKRPPSSSPKVINTYGSFEERCAAPGVVFCDPLDTEGPYDGQGNILTNDDGSEGLPPHTWYQRWRGIVGYPPEFTPPQLDTGIKASGSGSLHFIYPGNSTAAPAGSFKTNFSKDLQTQFGPGDVVYVQFRYRVSCELIYVDCDPQSLTYQQEHMHFDSTDGFWTAFKVSILGTGDREGAAPVQSCTNLEIVANELPWTHAMSGYHSCGWYSGFGEPRPGGETDAQPGGAYACYSDDGYTGPNCFYYLPDQWMTIQVRLEIGPWQSDLNQTPLSRVTVWAAHEGQPQRIVIDNMIHLRNPEHPEDRYGAIWLMPFMTGKSDQQVHPTAHIWYDELIVSIVQIANPK